MDLLCAQSKRSTGDRGRQVESLCDLSPDLLVDDLHQPPLLSNQLVQHIQIQHLLGHDWNTIDRSSCRGRKERKKKTINDTVNCS